MGLLVRDRSSDCDRPLAAAPIATQAKKPMIIMNAATSIITTKSPYIVRTSYTLPQASVPMGQWAAKNGIKRVFTLVSDYGPGIDSETFFKKGYVEGGGEIVGEVRVPLSNGEFAPYLQRIKDAKPDAVFVFLPAGEPIIAFMKGYAERGSAPRGGDRALHPGAQSRFHRTHGRTVLAAQQYVARAG